ncbi:PucR family transcriptional regulator [Nocardia bhagyanarayanae]|uniref:PucR family transcriptional regulator n=1 Tax=Nocardia bhagyanarayanae TaxID=1215925 RepID=UPI001FEC123F|nr:helix-turn-helix domain-containing protein [Nocardia bhagyanarayanae]
MTTARHDDVDPDRFIAATAARMHDRVTDVSAAICAYLEESIPELRGDPRTADLLAASVESNVATVLRALRYDLPAADVRAPLAAVGFARRLARQGVPANALNRAFRLGQRRMFELVFAELRTLAMPPAERISVIERITTTLFDFSDRIIEQLVAIYDDERERWLESQNSVRAVRVREVLDGRKSIDVDAVSEAIRYPLRWQHLALVLWYPEPDSDAIPRLQRFVRALGDMVAAASNPLVVVADQTSVWAWLPYRTAPGTLVADVRTFVTARRDHPNVVIGTVAAGIEGFRNSHRSAQRACSVALARGLNSSTVVAADDPGLMTAALLGGAVAETRDWVGEVLGNLAADDEHDERLRDTLRIFLGAGSSYKAAATELNLHSNSVKYRIGRAVARRGRPIGADRLDVELALLVCHWYGPAVLRPDPNQ